MCGAGQSRAGRGCGAGGAEDLVAQEQRGAAAGSLEQSRARVPGALSSLSCSCNWEIGLPGALQGRGCRDIRALPAAMCLLCPPPPEAAFPRSLGGWSNPSSSLAAEIMGSQGASRDRNLEQSRTRGGHVPIFTHPQPVLGTAGAGAALRARNAAQGGCSSPAIPQGQRWTDVLGDSLQDCQPL